MKYLLKYTLILTVLAFTSCESLLDKKPISKLSPENFFTNETELRAFSNQFYTVFPSTGLYTENWDNILNTEVPAEMRNGRSIPGSGGGWSFSSLRKVNTLLDNASNCEDEAVRRKYVALARFFRAYFYWNMVATFGDVPWYEHEMGSADPELYKPRDSREYVMTKMIEDIDYAIENLPSGKSVYTVTKWTALALKSRFCLFEGTFRKYHGITGYDHDYKYYLEQSADAAKEFILNSGYTALSVGNPMTNYFTLFTMRNASDEEVILARNYNATYGVTHWASNYTLVASMGRPGLTKKVIDSYLCKDGSRFTDKAGYATMSFVEETKNRDPRLSQTIRTPGYKRIDGTAALAPDLNASITGYQPIKYVTTPDQDGHNQSDIDLIIFRAGEVFLNYAEAKAELGTITQGDIDISIKRLRDRVGMPNMNLAWANENPDPYLMAAETGYPNVNGENKGIILEIRRERTVELMGEGFRYDDIIRWKEGQAFAQRQFGMYFPGDGDYDLDGNGTVDLCLYSSESAPASGAPLQYKIGQDITLSEGTYGYVEPHKFIPLSWNEERDYYYPIPTDERSLTHGALTQNPGWNDGLEF